MTYIIEIDNKTEASKKILSSIRKLQKEDSSVKITHKREKFRPLDINELSLPTSKIPTQEQLDEFLDRKDSRKPIALKQLRKNLDKRYSKSK